MKWFNHFFPLVGIWCLISFASGNSVLGQAKYEMAPINYSKSEPTDAVAEFAKKLADQSESLVWEDEHGYLKSLLEKLDVPVSSQGLVFSKTSLQVSRIDPKHPRAIYFNDSVYVGFVQRGKVIEISAADPKLGATFYSLSQEKLDVPILKRETSRCLQCHGSTHTRGRPGHIVRSVYPNETGMPEYGLGTHLISPLSKFENRFGGWYVTGTHGTARHLGNSWMPKSNKTGLKRFERDQSELDTEKGANQTELKSLVDTSAYLSKHSDIVAQLVLQHQVHMHNVLTEASFAAQSTIRDAKAMNKILEREEGHQSESTIRRFDSAAEKVVKALLFCDEVKLTDPVKGSSSFAAEFEKRGPFDSRKRSLRQFDLETRIFKYPCSFLIYSNSFNQLPTEVKKRVMSRLESILSGEDDSKEFEHLDSADRAAIKEILDATLKD